MNLRYLQELVPHIFIFKDQHFYGEKVGVYLIELDDKIILFEIPVYSTALKEEIKKLSQNKEIISILSHGSCGITDGTKWQDEINLKVYLHAEDKNHPWLRMKPDILYSEPQKVHKDIEIIHTPGHSAGSICLLHKPSKTLFTGDSIYTRNGKLHLDSNPELRKEGIVKLMDYDFENILPFHYEPVIGNAKAKLQAFLS